MKYPVIALGLALTFPFALQAQEQVNVQTRDASVQVSGDGVQVNVGDTKIDVRDSSVEVRGQTAAGEDRKAADILAIDGVERVVRHTCDAQHARTIHVNGSDNRVTVTGDCEDIVVAGTDNTITLDGAARIVVSGVDNKITYLRGKAGKPPVIQNTGVDNSVTRRPKP